MVENHGTSVKAAWLKWAFVIQALLLVLCLCLISFISIRFTRRQIEMTRTLAQQESDLKKSSYDLSTALFLRAQDAERSGDLGSARNDYLDALRVAPGDPFIWRRYALLSIRQNQAQQALDHFQKTAINSSDGRNLLTQSILNCALNQHSTADDLKKRALVSYTPTAQDREDFQSICNQPL